MKAGQLLTAEGALVLGGLGLAGAGTAIDIWAQTAGVAPGGTSHGELLGFNTTVTGLAFIAFGLFMAHRRFFMKRGHKRVYLAAILLIADGLIHLAAIGFHLNEPPEAAFFAVLVAVQVPAGLALTESTERLRTYWIYLALFLIAIYVVSRLASVPYLFTAEETDGLGVASKLLEVSLIAVLLSMRGKSYDATLRASEPGDTASEKRATDTER